MATSRSLAKKGATNKPKPKPVTLTETEGCGTFTGCNELTVGPGMPVGCADGALVKLFDSMPTEGNWVPVFVAGTGWQWKNAGPLMGLGQELAPPIPPAKDEPPPAETPSP